MSRTDIGASTSMRRLGRAWATLCAGVLVAILALGAAELAARALSGGASGPRATADALADQPEAEEMLAEVYSGQIRTRFAPFVHYRLAPFAGAHIHIDEEGWRRTPGTRTSTSGPTVWALGGSTMWGMGARDEGTIPAHLAAALGPEVRVENLGQVGYQSTQEVLTLLERLQSGLRPDVVVFYDGVNEVLPALKLGQVGVPLDVPRRELEFNLTRPGEQDRLLSATLRSLADGSVLIKKLLGGAPARAPVRIEDPEAMARRVVDVYAANVRVVQGMADRFGFRALFFWQPTAFSKRRRSPDEATFAGTRRAFSPLYAASAAADRRRLSGEVTDLSDVFADDPSPAFFDFCHVSEAGNRVIAQAILPQLRAALSAPPLPRAPSPSPE